jgi:hypothetical protein
MLHFQVCVNLDKQREKRRLAQNWKQKKHEEKKRKSLIPSSFASFAVCCWHWLLLILKFIKGNG